jgi:hypothetical protein
MRKAASRFLTGRGLKLTIDGQAYLEWLIGRAALRVAREGREDPETSLERAEQAVELLLETAAEDLGTPVGTTAPLGMYLLAVDAGGGRSISASNLRAALKKLCPIWPLCDRPAA